MPKMGYKKITTHKQCTRCKVLFLRNNENFHKTSQNYDGFSTTCKTCRNDSQRKYRCDHKEHLANLHHKLYIKNKKNGKRKQYRSNRRGNPINKVIDNLRNKTWCLLNRSSTKSKKYFKFNETIGCSPEQLKKHLEKQFTEGMSWNNYGMGGWHIDHIIPCDHFKPFTKKQQKECFHYTNLQPLWEYDNLSKGGFYSP